MSIEQFQFSLLRALVREMVARPHKYEWSYQGLGMLRAYMNDRKVRLHIWHPAYAVPGVSVLHTHPWDFKSLVVAGELVNTLYGVESGSQATHAKQVLECGPNGGLCGDKSYTSLAVSGFATLSAGHVYAERAEQIHRTDCTPGTVTLIERSFKTDTEHAFVFWPKDAEFVSAKPRPATNDEIHEFTKAAWSQLR